LIAVSQPTFSTASLKRWQSLRKDSEAVFSYPGGLRKTEVIDISIGFNTHGNENQLDYQNEERNNCNKSPAGMPVLSSSQPAVLMGTSKFASASDFARKLPIPKYWLISFSRAPGYHWHVVSVSNLETR